MDLNAPVTNALKPQGQGATPEKTKFSEQYDKGSTIGNLGEQMGIDQFVWGFMSINKDAATTPEQFQKMMKEPTMIRALPRAAVVRHSEQLKTMEKQFMIEKDPAKKQQIKTNYDNLSGQINILRDYIEKGPDRDLIATVLKEQGITDPGAVDQAMNRWKETEKAGTVNQTPAEKGAAPAGAGPSAAGGVDAIIQKFLEA